MLRTTEHTENTEGNAEQSLPVRVFRVFRGLSFLVFLAWSLFFAPKPPVEQKDKSKQTAPEIVEEKAATAKPYVKEKTEVKTVEAPTVETEARLPE